MVPEFVGQDDRTPGRAAASDPGTAAALLRRGQLAARNGDHGRAARLMRAALIADPTNAEARLWLAALADDPRESVQLLTEVLQEHPDHTRAAEGLRWAYDRLEAQRTASASLISPVQARAEGARRRWRLSMPLVGIVLSLAVIGGALLFMAGRGWAGARRPAGTVLAASSGTATPAGALAPALATDTATPAATASSVPLSPTATATETARPTATPTVPPPTATPTPVPPTAVPPTAAPAQEKPAGQPAASRAGKWIEVDLSSQTAIAWEGQTPVRRMIVSTGVASHPTVTGTYRIYEKLVSTRMTGPGYDLPNVPHTMYFYRGFALHGAYWHNNFGTPMSHGCVNLNLRDAAWLFNWAGPTLPPGASVVYASDSNPGTLVVIHY